MYVELIKGGSEEPNVLVYFPKDEPYDGYMVYKKLPSGMEKKLYSMKDDPPWEVFIRPHGGARGYVIGKTHDLDIAARLIYLHHHHMNEAMDLFMMAQESYKKAADDLGLESHLSSLMLAEWHQRVRQNSIPDPGPISVEP